MLGATVVGCDPEEEAINSGMQPVATPGGGGSLPPGTTAGGAGGTTGGPGGATAGGGTTGAPSTTGGVPPVQPGGGTTGGVATTGGATGGGSAGGATSQWCQVKSVLATKCGSCHGNTLAGGAPFPLVTYEHLTAAHPTKAGQKVYQRVGLRVHADKSQTEGLGVMPPGAQLPAADLALIDAWVAAQAPAGADPTCAGAGPTQPPQQSVEWPPKECDGVYKLTANGGAPNTPAMAPPGVESHPQVTFDAPWGNEQVQAIGFKTITDNAKVLHHWILYANGLEFITGWAPGEDGVRMMKPDIGMLLPGGARTLRLDMHYFNTMGTKAEPDQSGVEICVVKKANFRKNTAAVTMGLSNLFFSIPAGSSNYEVKSSCTVSGNAPITILTASPHAHKHARRMIFTVQKKNGQMIEMHNLPFQFGEQKSFALDPPVVVEAGDVINTTCVYANDSGRPVTFGESTEDEMCFNFATYYPAGALTCGIGGIDFGSLGGLFGP